MARDVLIVYMNETGESQHYLPIIDNLISMGHAAAAVRIAEDLRTFAGVCYQELLDLAWGAADPESGFNLNFVAFTNDGVRRRNFRCFDTATRNLTYGSIEVPDSVESLYQVTPLANPQTFALALGLVADRFNPKAHRFHLIAKSHGNSRTALTSLLSTKLGLPRQELNQAVKAFPVDSDGLGQAGLGQGGLGQVGLGEFVLPEDRDGIGTTKEEFLETLGQDDAGTRMRFRTVVLESCQSYLNEELRAQIPANVDRVFTSNAKSLRYKTIDYSRLLDGKRALEEAFTTVLDDVFVEQRRGNRD
ncbi:MAG: hypothetical protein AAFU85_30570 [Planctomycetota bacterium]